MSITVHNVVDIGELISEVQEIIDKTWAAVENLKQLIERYLS